MPELPEVETVRRSLAPYIIDSVFTDFKLLHAPSLHSLSLPLDSLRGKKIKALERRGKLLIFSLSACDPDSSLGLIVHLRMTGRLLTANANAGLGRHTRCVFALKNPARGALNLFFDDIRTFGKIMLANDAVLKNWNFWQQMGPEPFDLESASFKERLHGQRALKTALLDQAVIAGLGNIYVDETLFAAGLHPCRASGSLSLEEADILLKSIKEILALAISKRGSSIRDYRDADGKAGDFQNYFAVYGRAGKQCRKCGSTLEKIRLGGRATVFCPACQKEKPF